MNTSRTLVDPQLGYLHQVQALRPRDGDQLHRFIRVMLGPHIPRQPLIPGHNAPFEYLLASFFEDRPSSHPHPAGDLLVWANRGGGKTFLGALATLLDLLFKPGIQIRILGGSFEQSSKMYRYLTDMLRRPWLEPLLAKAPTQRRIELINHSAVEVLAQSERSVRGQHVHKLRCDEVELFKPEIWQAAQLITRSAQLDPVAVRGTVEAMSTMHRPFGLMSQLADRTQDHTATPAAPRLRLLRWSAMDVIERCPPPTRLQGLPSLG